MEIKYINLKNKRNDCFFVLNGECYHRKRISKSCEREDCKFYLSRIPLKKKHSKNNNNFTQKPLKLTARRKRGKN